MENFFVINQPGLLWFFSEVDITILLVAILKRRTSEKIRRISCKDVFEGGWKRMQSPIYSLLQDYFATIILRAKLLRSSQNVNAKASRERWKSEFLQGVMFPISKVSFRKIEETELYKTKLHSLFEFDLGLMESKFFSYRKLLYYAFTL